MSFGSDGVKSNLPHRETTMAVATSKGIVDVPTNQTVDQTVAKLKNILQSKGVTLFALVDHSGEAEKAGMKMSPTKLLIFGSPKAGTPLMLAAPSIAIDLPLKILVWEDNAGKVRLSYNNPEYLKERHNLPPELLATSLSWRRWRPKLRNSFRQCWKFPARTSTTATARRSPHGKIQRQVGFSGRWHGRAGPGSKPGVPQ